MHLERPRGAVLKFLEGVCRKLEVSILGLSPCWAVLARFSEVHSRKLEVIILTLACCFTLVFGLAYLIVTLSIGCYPACCVPKVVEFSHTFIVYAEFKRRASLWTPRVRLSAVLR